MKGGGRDRWHGTQSDGDIRERTTGSKEDILLCHLCGKEGWMVVGGCCRWSQVQRTQRSRMDRRRRGLSEPRLHAVCGLVGEGRSPKTSHSRDLWSRDTMSSHPCAESADYVSISMEASPNLWDW